MAQIFWNGGSGSWGSGDDNDWTGGQAPSVSDDVTIAVAGVTVSIDAGLAAYAHTLRLVNSTLNIDGGTLYTVENATFNGNYVQTAGTYTMSGHGATFNTGIDFAGGTINALSGAVILNNGGLLAGTLTGAGALDVVAGTAYIYKGFSASIASIVVGAQGGKLGLNTNFTYANNFTLLQNGVLGLFGHTLNLKGNSLIQGVVGYGKLVDGGTLTLSSPQTTAVLDNGLILSVSGLAIQAGNIAMGASDAGAKINVTAQGQYQINGNWNISNPASVAQISNAGNFAKTFGAKTSQVNASFSSTGTVSVNAGTLLLNGPVNSLGGTVSGGGTLGIAGVQTTLANKVALNVATINQQSGVLVLNHALTYAGQWDMTGGVLNLNANAAKLTLTGPAAFDGGTLTGFGGSVILDGASHVGNVTIGGPVTLDVVGSLDQSSTITFGASSNPTAIVEAGATWTLEGDSNIVGFFGLIENSGSFVDPNGSGNAVVQASLINSGTLTVNNSTLTLAGSNSLGGVVNGTGLLDVQGFAGLNKGVALNVAAFAVDNGYVAVGANLSYANIFLESGNQGVLDLEGHAFTLTGAASLDAGLLTDGGTLAANGNTVLGAYSIGGGATLSIGGSAEQTAGISVDPNSGPGTLAISSHGIYTLDDDVGIAGQGNVINAGTFNVSGTGTSAIAADFINAGTGTFAVNDQLLQLGDGGLLGGSITGAGTLQLANVFGGAVYQLSAGASLSVASLYLSNQATLAVAANLAYGGFFQANVGTITMGGQTLSLSGTTALSGVLEVGPGTLSVSGSGTFAGVSVSSGAQLAVSGTVEQLGNLYVGDQPSLTTPPSTAVVSVAATGTYTLDANASIVNNGTLAVAGQLIANGNGTSVLGATIVDTGVISANLGTLNVLGAVGGSGVFSIGTGGLLQFSNSATVAASNFISFTTGGGALTLDNPAHFAAILENFSKGDTIGLAGFDAATLGGAYANGDHTAVTFTDSIGDSVTLTFSTAQNLSQFTYGAGPQSLATITHS